MDKYYLCNINSKYLRACSLSLSRMACANRLFRRNKFLFTVSNVYNGRAAMFGCFGFDCDKHHFILGDIRLV